MGVTCSQRRYNVQIVTEIHSHALQLKALLHIRGRSASFYWRENSRVMLTDPIRPAHTLWHGSAAHAVNTNRLYSPTILSATRYRLELEA